MKTYSGIYKVKNPKKYRGDPNNVIYRSGWEKNVMLWCDRTTDVIEWSSEEIIIPYRYDLDKRVHRYFVDFLIKMKDGTVYLIEVKPHKETEPPKGSRRTKKYLNEASTYVMNQNKWKAAEEYAARKGWKFQIWTENTLRKMGILPKTPKPMKKLPPFRKKKSRNKT